MKSEGDRGKTTKTKRNEREKLQVDREPDKKTIDQIRSRE